MVQKPLKKVKIVKKPTKYFKRSTKDKSEDYKITKEINKKNMRMIEELSKRTTKVLKPTKR